jgi:uncharacterized protein (TIGR03435 family)
VSWRVIGPDWLDSDRYDIAAKVPPGATKEQMNLMLQRLLAERFGLVAHRETRSVPAYRLTAAKGGPKMKPAEKGSANTPRSAPPNGDPVADTDFCTVLPPGVPRTASWDVGRNRCWTGRMQSLSAIAWKSEINLMRPVIDDTGLTGLYDFRLRFLAPELAEGNIDGTIGDVYEKSLPPELAAAAAYPAPTLVVASEAQLGLELQSTKAPIEVLVVDKANRRPTEN